MNSQSYEAESSIGMNLRAQNNESFITSANKNLTTRCFHIKLRILTQMPLWKFHNKKRIPWPCLHSNLMHLTLSFSTYEYKFFCGTHLLELMTINHTSDAHFQPSYGRIR